MAEMFSVMAAQLQEEEQTQRTMVALKEMAPFYPGRSQSEVQAVLEQVRGSCDASNDWLTVNALVPKHRPYE